MNVLLLGRMASWCARELETRLGPGYSITAVSDTGRLEDYWPQVEAAEVIVGWPVSNEALRRAANLRLLHVAGAGIDGLDLDAVPPHVRVCNTFHHEVAIAEYVMMAMLNLARRPAHYDARLRQGDWTGSCIWGETPVLAELFGREALLVGLGHIAREIAVRAHAFGIRLTGASRNPVPAEPFSRVVSFRDWEACLPDADFVIPCCPLTPETTGLIGAAQFARMKQTAFLINITRGRVVDERAAYEALRDRRIAGAALDVWYQYPNQPDEQRLPSRYPFHELPNVLLSPHNSGWTMRTILGRAGDIAANIQSLAAGGTLRNVVR